jgi:single-strand DNA-binding protein
MKSVNKTQLVGYLAKDPEVREFSTGTLKANLVIGTQSKTRQTDLFGKPVYHTTWHTVVIWGRERVEKIIDQYIKGSHVMIEGNLFYQSYTDKSGIKRVTTVINAYSLMNLHR